MVYLHDKYSPNKNIPENPTTSRYDSCESTGEYNIWPLGTKNQSHHSISFAQDVSWARHWWLITCCCYFCVERRVIDESSGWQTYAELIDCLIDWLLDWLIDWLTYGWISASAVLAGTFEVLNDGSIKVTGKLTPGSFTINIRVRPESADLAETNVAQYVWKWGNSRILPPTG